MALNWWRPRQQRRTHVSPAHRPYLEGLENRRLLAADVVVALDNGVLEITGTRKSDSISVALHGPGAGEIDVIIVGQPTQTFAESAVAEIRIHGKGGDDTLSIGAGILVPVQIDGGSGDDTITGGDGDDDLNGDSGNDTINGGAGDDNCTGGSGKDVISGDDGDDLIRGDSGKDILDGDAGNDNCDGGSGNDEIDGGDGNDLLSGGNGRDSLRGGLGDDDLDGGSGNDDLNGDDGNDRCHGGGGRDNVDGGIGDDRIRGGKGKDDLVGGDGIDAFDDSEDRERSSDRGEDDVSDDSENIDLADLPAPVLAAFNAQFPGVRVIEVEQETEDAGILYKIDFLNADRIRQRVVFDAAGTLLQAIGRSGHGHDDGQQIDLNDLPQAVLDTFTTNFPGASIQEIEREVEDQGAVYKIDFTDAQEVRKRAEYAQDGTQLDVENR